MTRSYTLADVTAVRAEQVIDTRHGGWALPARLLLAVLLRAAALAGHDPDQVKAWAGGLTPAVIGQVDAILTGRTPTGAGNDTEAALTPATTTTGGQRP